MSKEVASAVLVYLFICVLVGIWYKVKHRSFLHGYLLSILTTPIFGYFYLKKRLINSNKKIRLTSTQWLAVYLIYFFIVVVFFLFTSARVFNFGHLFLFTSVPILVVVIKRLWKGEKPQDIFSLKSLLIFLLVYSFSTCLVKEIIPSFYYGTSISSKEQSGNKSKHIRSRRDSRRR